MPQNEALTRKAVEKWSPATKHFSGIKIIITATSLLEV